LLQRTPRLLLRRQYNYTQLPELAPSMPSILRISQVVLPTKRSVSRHFEKGKSVWSKDAEKMGAQQGVVGGFKTIITLAFLLM
jgi:hypothetical protein